MRNSANKTLREIAETYVREVEDCTEDIMEKASFMANCTAIMEMLVDKHFDESVQDDFYNDMMNDKNLYKWYRAIVNSIQLAAKKRK